MSFTLSQADAEVVAGALACAGYMFLGRGQRSIDRTTTDTNNKVDGVSKQVEELAHKFTEHVTADAVAFAALAGWKPKRKRSPLLGLLLAMIALLRR